MKNLCIIVPGMGYNTDRPLLYYSGKLAKQLGYEIIRVSFGELNLTKEDVQKDGEGTVRKYMGVMAKALEDVDFGAYDRVVFITKSIGTIAAAAYAMEQGITTGHIFFTPLPDTFRFFKSANGLAFSGDEDPMADAGVIEEKCRATGIGFTLIAGGNHSLETGDVLTDAENLPGMLETIRSFLEC